MNQNAIQKVEAAPHQVDLSASPKTRLLEAGAKLFAENGFGGTSVRAICELAGTSSNMVHHYFGSKSGLHDEIFATFSEEVFEVPLRLIDVEVASKEEFAQRLEIFIAETFEALIRHRYAYRFAASELVILPAMQVYREKFTAFVERAKAVGVVRARITPELFSGLVLDRLGAQIIYAGVIKAQSPRNPIDDRDYRKLWVKSNTDLLLYGLVEE